MIIDVDFLDHWRTQMICDALDDPLAPLYLIRLWAHCQASRTDTLKMPPAGLKAQCRYAGDAQKLEAALSESKFIERKGESIHVLGWKKKNAALFNAWENGAKGGRPKQNKGGAEISD